MKKIMFFLVFFLSISKGYSQNYWIHSLHGYDAGIESKSFQLSGNEIFINTWSDPSTGLPSIIKKINP